MNSELVLPDAIIQHIQSFLDVKQAVRTCILSKSWYNAWFTRPNIEFDQCHFRDHDPESQGFLELVKKTMQRYHQSNLESNLKIQSFKLSMTSYKGDNYSLTKELILKAIYTMGASSIDLLLPAATNFVLPNEVLGSETLISLSLCKCKIDLGKVRCWRLKSLKLKYILFLEGDIIWDIILCCPLIEELEIDNCKVESFNAGKLMLGRPYEFKRLKSLWLKEVNIDTLFFSSKFPCLKDLRIHSCYGYEEIRVSSRSLEFISILHYRGILKATFDVPSTCEFDFDGCCLPSFTFKEASRERVCNLYIACYMQRTTSWFIDLKKLFQNLSSSRIYLHLAIWEGFLKNGFAFDYANASDLRGLPKPVVENLTLCIYVTSPISYAFLESKL